MTSNREENSDTELNFSSDEEWSQTSICVKENGILAPIPLSVFPMQTELQVGEHQEAFESNSKSGRKRRKSIIKSSNDMHFKLFKFVTVYKQYILEMHETSHDEIIKINRCHLSTYDDNGKWKMRIHNLSNDIDDHAVLQVTEDSNPSSFKKNYNMTLENRLTDWKFETRIRYNGHEDKFYYHGGRQFRSFVEVATFIVYACKPKDLELSMPADDTLMMSHLQMTEKTSEASKPDRSRKA